MKSISIITVLCIMLIGLSGCVNSGSSFIVLSIDYPSDTLLQSEGGILVDEIASLCKSVSLEARQPVVSSPALDNPYALFRSVSDKEPIIWVMIYRSAGNRVEVIISSLKEYEASTEVRSLRSAIEAQMRTVASHQGRILNVDQHGNSILH